jgi:molybdopterin converting factor small subunit
LRIQVRLHGILRTAANTDRLEFEFGTRVSVRQLVAELVNTIGNAEFERYLVDVDLKDPRPNSLILVSGTEIGALDGLETTLKDGDEVVFLPVAHGGSDVS